MYVCIYISTRCHKSIMPDLSSKMVCVSVGCDMTFLPYTKGLNRINPSLIYTYTAMIPRYHEWMKDPYLLEATASEPLSLKEELDMQKAWLLDEDKLTFIIHHKGVMVGDINLFFDVEEDEEDGVCAEVCVVCEGLFMLNYV